MYFWQILFLISSLATSNFVWSAVLQTSSSRSIYGVSLWAQELEEDTVIRKLPTCCCQATILSLDSNVTSQF